MEKVKLKNGTVLEFKEIQDAGNLLIMFENQEFTDLRALFDNPENLSSIEILTEGDAVCAVYNGYTKADKYIIQGTEITVYLVRPDENQLIQDLQKQVDYLSNTIVVISIDK